jgi:hypothetical protein
MTRSSYQRPGPRAAMLFYRRIPVGQPPQMQTVPSPGASPAESRDVFGEGVKVPE